MTDYTSETQLSGADYTSETQLSGAAYTSETQISRADYTSETQFPGVHDVVGVQSLFQGSYHFLAHSHFPGQ
jgi:hypothetical protein